MRSTFGSGDRSCAVKRPVMSLLRVSLICLLLASGCGKPPGTVLGKAPKGEAHTILSVHAGNTPPQVTLSGVMIEKCPTAGCWFRLQDGTGVIKVDTKSAGFVVVNVPLDTKMTVAGKLTTPDGHNVQLEATGIQY